MRPFTEIVDALAKEETQRIWAKVPVADGEGLSWRDVTYRQLGAAADIMAHWMDQHIGQVDQSGHQGNVVTYMGVHDIRPPILVLATLKTGHKALLTSPRNSIEGHLHLMNATKSTRLIFTKELRTQAMELAMRNDNITVVQAPDVDSFLNDDTQPSSYPSKVGNDIADTENVLILHSSGTTGLPKPIPIKAGVYRGIESLFKDPAPKGRRFMYEDLHNPRVTITTLPFFHAFGFAMFVGSIYHPGTLALLPSNRPPSAELVLSAMEKTKASTIIIAPSILEDIGNLPGGPEAIAKLDAVLYGGAPLAHTCGDKMSKLTRLVNAIGSTEMYFISGLVVDDPADWEYFEWDDSAGVDMEETSDPNLAEMVLKRDPSKTLQFVFYNFPDLNEWRTKDLFERHPTKPDLWKYVGRLDDVLVLSNGEKINPINFEKALEGHPKIKGALMVGSRRFQAAVLVEPRHDQQDSFDEADYIREIWPWVEKANAEYPTHARVWQSMVVLATPGKPFVRAAKGSIMRNATNKLYEPELDRLYGRSTTQTPDSPAPKVIPCGGAQNGARLNGFSTTSPRSIVRDAVVSVLTNAGDITDDNDLFSLGMDSLQALQLSKILNLRVGGGGISRSCSSRTIYENPTIKTLSQAIAQPGFSSHGHVETGRASREEKMSAIIHKYTRSIPHKLAASSPRGLVVVLTGSTGSLGTYLLNHLLTQPHVSHIYCLNRDPQAADRQARLFTSRGLDPRKLSNDRVTFHTANLNQNTLGLSSNVYNNLLRDVELFIHSAWPVNFNHTLAEFEPAIAGTRACANFATAARHAVHVVFVSSVASVMNFPAVRGFGRDEGHDGDSRGGKAFTHPNQVNGHYSNGNGHQTNGNGFDNQFGVTIPEDFDPDNSLPARQGYGESKHVAECILAEAARRTGIRVTILRSGQLAGPAEGGGVWNRHEWLPSLVATSKAMGGIPSTLGSIHDAVDWIPVDVAAQVMVELSVAPGDRESPANVACFNIVNPKTTSWRELAGSVQEYYKFQGKSLELIPLDQWVDRLERVDVTKEKNVAQRYPALKLGDFFRSMSDHGSGSMSYGFGTELAAKRSPTMSQLAAVDGRLMKKWLADWGF